MQYEVEIQFKTSNEKGILGYDTANYNLVVG